jgi:hypothetical protein
MTTGGTVTYELAGVTVRFTGLPAEVLRILQALLFPLQPATADRDSSPDLTVSIARGNRASECTGRRSEIALHSGATGTRYDTAGGFTAFRHDGRGSYQVDHESGQLEFAFSAPYCSPAWMARDVLQVVRGWIVQALEREGWARLHGAVCELGGRSVAVIGPKAVGKTSFLLAELLGRSRAALVTNDKAMVRRRVNGQVDVLGLPYAIPVHVRSLQTWPVLATIHPYREIGSKRYFDGAVLHSALGLEFKPQSILHSVIHPLIAPGRGIARPLRSGTGPSGPDLLWQDGAVFPQWLRSGAPSHGSPDEVTAELPIYCAQGDPFLATSLGWLTAFEDAVFPC